MSFREGAPVIPEKPSDSLPGLPPFVVKKSTSTSAKAETLQHVRNEDMIQYRNFLRRGLGVNSFTNQREVLEHSPELMSAALEKIYSTSGQLLTTYKSYEGLGEAYSLIVQRFRGILAAVLDSTDPRSIRVELGLDILTEVEGAVASEICSGIGLGDRAKTAEVMKSLAAHLTGSMKTGEEMNPSGKGGGIVTDNFLNALFSFPLEDSVS